MSRYQVAENKIVTAIIHVKSYLTILGLIKWELTNPDLTLQ